MLSSPAVTATELWKKCRSASIQTSIERCLHLESSAGTFPYLSKCAAAC